MIVGNFFDILSKLHHYRIYNYAKNLDFNNLIDVGSHKGEFLSSFLRIEKINKFYCFEPQNIIFKTLKDKFSKSKKIKLYNYALGKNLGKKKLYLSNLSSTSTMSKFNHRSKYLMIKNFLIDNKNKNIIFVKQTTIDHVFKGISLKKSFLKIDVEGFEINVLKGAQKKISEVKYLLVEQQILNQYQNNFHQVNLFLVKKNFEIVKNFYFPTLHYKDVLYRNKNNPQQHT